MEYMYTLEIWIIEIIDGKFRWKFGLIGIRSYYDLIRC